MTSSKKRFHYCTGKKVCDDPAHGQNYDNGGMIDSSRDPQNKPSDDTYQHLKSRGANENQDLSQGWENVKSEVGSLFGGSDAQAQNKAKGGEIEPMDGSDDELMDMAADELMQSMEKKDKKGMLEAIRAIVLNCKE